MGKWIGIIMIGIGIYGSVYDWILSHRNRKKRMEELLVFFRKAAYSMEDPHTRWIFFFEEYNGGDECVTESVHEVARRLKENRYPMGETAWKEVMEERKTEWDFSKEAYELLLSCGACFFGKSKAENLEILRMYMI